MSFVDPRSQTSTFSAVSEPVFRTTIETLALPPARTCFASQRFESSSVVLGACGRGVGGGGGGDPIAMAADAVLFTDFGSAVDAPIVATFVADPPAPPSTRTRIVNVTFAAAGSEPTVHTTLWPAAEHEPLAETNASSHGSVSVTTTLVAASGPTLWTVRVNSTVSPTFALPTPTLVISRSADGAVGVGVDAGGGGGGGALPAGIALVAVLLAAFGSTTPAGAATDAVFVSDPLVPPGIVPVSVTVADAPDAIVTAVETLPVPDAGEHPGAQAHVKLAKAAGTASVTVAPTTSAGPPFDTVIVYVSDEPGTYDERDATFVIERSA